MKTYIKLLMGACVASFLTACDYEAINTDEFGMTDAEGAWDGIGVGGQLTTMQRYVVPVGTQADATDMINQYQIAFNLSSDVWSGYFGQNNNWSGGNNNTANYLIDGWVASTYTNTYTNMLAPWKKLKIEAEKINAPEIYAIAQIVKIAAWHKTLESFGPMPYSHAADNSLSIPFDSERVVYTAMLADLETSVNELADAAAIGKKVLEAYDAVYAGDPVKWVKFGNTLMLRLAMHVRYADETLAKEYATKAVSQPLGLMTLKDDEAKMGNGAGLQFINNIYWLSDNYDECRMGCSILSYLAGYEDPRLPVYFRSVERQWNGVDAFDGKYYSAIPYGNVSSKNDYYGIYTSKPNFTANTPTYWMRASEAYFLRAEAALVWGGTFGDAASLYAQGIQTSFDENGISSSAASYMASGKAPIDVTEIWGKKFTAPTTATPEFTGTTEQKLEKIITQKWLALFPNGQEAWTEYRRTGYPKLMPCANNRGASQGVSASEGVRRLTYPSSFRITETNLDIYNDAVEKLGGTDGPATHLWFDCKH